jgi:hypothetical protein
MSVHFVQNLRDPSPKIHIGEVVVERTHTGRIVWTKQIDDYLRHCIKARMTNERMARLLGITRNAVIGRIYRMRKSGCL